MRRFGTMKLGLFAVLFTLAAQAARADAPPNNDAAALSVAEQAVEAAGKAADAAAAAATAAKAAAEAAKQFVHTSAPAAAPKPAEAPVLKPSLWDGTISLDIISLTGNATSLTGSASAAVEHKSDNWIFGIKADGKYGQSRPTQDAALQVLAEQASVQLRLDRRFSPRYAGYVQGGADMDHVKSIRSRGFGEVGVSISWVDDKEGALQKMLVRTDLALRGQREDRFQFFPEFKEVPGVTLIAPRFGVAFRYALTKEIIFMQDFEIITNVYGDSRVLVNSASKFASRLSASLAVTAGFELHYDSNPAPTRVNSDSALTLGLQLAL
jgi:hypothetical protein